MPATILIADDDAVQRRLVENMVQKCGYETITVDSGDAAIAMLTAPDTPPIEVGTEFFNAGKCIVLSFWSWDC